MGLVLFTNDGTIQLLALRMELTMSLTIIAGASKAKRMSYREKALRRENLRQVVNEQQKQGRPLSKKEVLEVCDVYRSRLEKKGYFDLT